MTRSLLLSFFILTYLSLNPFAQDQYTGYHMDNYSGTVNVRTQPAEIVDNRYRFFIGSGFSLAQSNNYRSTNFNSAFFFGSQFHAHRDHKYRGYDTEAFTMDVISSMFEINHKNSFGYSMRFNNSRSLDGLPGELTLADYNDFIGNGNVNSAIDYHRLSIQRFSYLEHAFNYGRIIKEDNQHYLKAGISAKIINGVDAGYFFSKDGTITFQSDNSSQLALNTGNASFGMAENNFSLDNRKSGVGLDLGVVYEFRPEYDSFKYNMDGEKDIPRYDVNKYKFKAGASITNIGFVKFAKDPLSYDFSAVNSNVDGSQLGVNNIGFSPLNYISSTVLTGGGATKSGSNKNTFRMSLPTSLNLQFDYHIWGGFYASYAGAIPVNIPGDPNRIYAVTTHAITPRYEQKYWSIATPITIKRNGQFNLGVVGRISTGYVNFFIGSHSMTFMVGRRRSYDASFFCGINFGLMHRVPADRDKDEVSDKKDRCPDDPGPWIYKGCPDTDNDGIIDLEDHCIYDQGPKKTDGCPDRDNDGVIDVNDRCPDTPGLAVHYGCPDRDRDGVIDLADRCPDVPGIELNNGCPFENQGCCMDNDGDGISNNVDKCPDVSGSVYNEGCPIDSSNFDKINFDAVKPNIDANHTEVQIEDTLQKGSTEVDKGKENEPVLIQSLEDIPVMENGKELRKLTVYFDTDQSFMKKDYVRAVNSLIEDVDPMKHKDYIFVVIGHTDNDGSDTYNLLLSKRRAETVKKHLINQGVPEKQIKVYYFGEWQPLYSNDNEEKKSINRRAEIKIIKQ